MSEGAGAIVVTGAGAAGGLGAGIASAFACAGARVFATDLSTPEPALFPDGVITARCDVTDEDQVEELARHAISQHGGIATWINNAGITRPAMLHKMSVGDFDAVMTVHVRGTFLGVRAAARAMIEAGDGGTILNVTSSAGLQGTIGQVNYSAAKGAITALTQSAAKELARHDIRVNAVAPMAATPMTETLRADDKLREQFLARVPMGRFGAVDEIVSTFVFLASPAAKFITGQVVCVDGGLYMAS